MPLSAGRLRHRVTIRRPVQTKTGDGGFETVWTDVATVYAEVLGLNSRESMIGQALQGVSSYRVTVRFGTDITDADQLRYGVLDLNVRSISDPDGRREQLLILADTASAQATG
ncbi:phage head closure protein [Sphingomonas sp. TREG-RG-20F-R18-01]|uniref:phage head closure protein n=1 Tax=Sphingomonas sp. TREG-RG-20F-R18-01 TaxID=2914982 RepID=UPI001F570D67|nr:phage head closure protein [Sphingomonas sp. TREG-RG-20F-R18-01]